MSQWTVGGPETIAFDEPVGTLHVRTINGTVNVVAADGPARLEVSELEGEPLLVTLEGGVLTVAYKDLSWGEFGEAVKSVQSVKFFFAQLRRKRRAVVSLSIPGGSAVKIGTVSADTTVSGISGEVAVHGASGAATLVGLAGKITANTVSGDVDAQDVAGELLVNTVSGGLTLIAGSADKVQVNTVNGGVTMDLDTQNPTDIKITTVSGPVGIRLPSLADAKVEAGSTTGDITSTFDELKVSGSWGWKKLTGQLGTGTGRLQVTTVSGAVTVLRRQDAEDAADIEDAVPQLVKELPAAPDQSEEV